LRPPAGRVQADQDRRGTLTEPDPTSAKRTRNPEETRRRILEAAEDEAADTDLDAVRSQMGIKYAGGHGESVPADPADRVFRASARGRSWRWVVLEPTHVVTWDNHKLPR